ncbi:MAG: hypothetical protein ACRDJL_13070 [Actinomycetota bacterium]
MNESSYGSENVSLQRLIVSIIPMAGRVNQLETSSTALRHTFGGLWIAARIDPEDVSVRAGHRSCWMRYQKVSHLGALGDA